jgi:hypothetical protein
MPNDVSFFVGELEDQKSEWKLMADHEAAMECRDLEDKLRRGIGLFSMIRLSDESWSKKVQDGSAKFSPPIALSINAAYKWWLTPCEEILSQVEKTQRQFKVDNAEHFGDCVRLAKKLAAIDVEGVIESIEQAQKGQTELLTDEVWGELLNQNNS